MKVLRYSLPLIAFLVLCGFLLRGLYLDPKLVPSPLIGKPAASFRAPDLGDPNRVVASDAMRGKVWLLNVWGSWCGTCRDEHETLMALAARKLVPIIGLDWKDDPGDARQWLRELGNPYSATGVDANGSIAIDYGVYAAPESFLIDRNGVIRHKVIGELTPEIIDKELVPLINKLNQ